MRLVCHGMRPRTKIALPHTQLTEQEVSSSQIHIIVRPFCKSLTNQLVLTPATAKAATKGVASFALVPSTDTHPLTSNIVYVNTEDEIGFLSTHDVPKHILWSSRGDLAIGLGTEYRIFPGFRESVPQPDPWNIPFSSNLNSETKDRRGGKTSRSHTRRVSPEPLGFGRGDKDGFPALNATTKDSASVSAKTRRFSPSPLRISPLEYSKVSDAVEGIETALRDNLLEPAVARPDGTVLHLGTRHRRGDGTRSVSRNHRKETLHHNVIEKDISMMMRTRTCVGYGVQNVSSEAV